MSNTEIVYAATADGQPLPPGEIHFSLSFFPLAIFFYFCTPVVVINGVAVRLSWGNHRFLFHPGDYAVEVYFPYLFFPKCGANMMFLRLDPGAARYVSFYMWPWVFTKGQMSVH
ncbi:MAG: hypothetical protein U0939_25950 [Pirellulales bacterium]